MTAAARKRTTVGDLISHYVGEAQRNPDQAPQIYRKGAEDFARLAQKQKDMRARTRLHDLACELLDMSREQERQSAQATTDDFEEALQESAEAFERGGEQDMDIRRQIHEEGGVPRVSIAPETFHRDAALGRSAVLKFNPSAEEKLQGIVQSQTLAFWQGSKNEAQAITVDVGLISPPAAPPPPTGLTVPEIARPYAVVEYGSDGNRTAVKFDVRFGTRFTVVGNYVSVLAGMDGPRSGTVAAQMTIGASIGTFAAPSQAPVTLTEYIDFLDDGASTDFIQLPMKAAQILPLQTNATGGTTILSFFPVGGGSVALYIVSIPSGTLGMVPIPIAGDVGCFTVTNNTGGSASYRVVYQLSL